MGTTIVFFILFVDKFKKINGAKIVDSGNEITEKEQSGCIGMIQQEFSKYGKNIPIIQDLSGPRIQEGGSHHFDENKTSFYM